MTLQEWINFINNNKGIDYDGMYGKQCVDLVNHYAYRVLGIKNAFLGNNINYAYQIYTMYNNIDIINKNFKLTANSPTNMPKQGDIIVWSKERNGKAGHTAVVLSATPHTITVFEQNYDGSAKSGNSIGAIRTYTYNNYNNVLGWLTPKKLEVYGNAKVKTSQPIVVFSDSCLVSSCGVLYNNDRVLIVGTGTGNYMLSYPVDNYFKVGFVPKKFIVVD